MTFKEAQDRVNATNKEGPSWWCPVSQAKCRKDCFSYSPAHIHDNGLFRGEEIYIVMPQTCTYLSKQP